MGFFDKIMSHEDAKKVVKEEGWDSYLNLFQQEYESYNLYSCSTYWFNADDPNYICKFRGTCGDIVIGWEGVHDK
jgi:signal peptidase I